jgi:hypothetical protein
MRLGVDDQHLELERLDLARGGADVGNVNSLEVTGVQPAPRVARSARERVATAIRVRVAITVALAVQAGCRAISVIFKRGTSDVVTNLWRVSQERHPARS